MNNWYEIVDILSSNITYDISEEIYQREIISCLRMLGWRSKEGTLKEQVTLPIGNNNSIRPDIVLYKDNLPVLPIEIKRPTNISSSKEEKQLMSYMRQLKLNVGLFYFCNSKYGISAEGATVPRQVMKRNKNKKSSLKCQGRFFIL